MRRVIAHAVLVAGVCQTSGADAHHPNPTARPAGAAPDLGLAFDSSAARLDARVATEWSYFGRLLDRESTRPMKGGLLVGLVVPAVHAVLPTETRLIARLPVGFLQTQRPGQKDDVRFGAGDAVIEVSQPLNSFWKGRTITFGVRLGVVIPTGRYAPDDRVAVNALSGSAAGAFDMVTYNAQASLGADVWSLRTGAEVGWRPHRRWRIGLLGLWTEPLSQTQDNIQWGRDVDGQLELTFVPWLSRLAVTVGVDCRWHDQDDLPNEEGAGRSLAGGRREVGGSFGFGTQFVDQFACGARVHVPLLQRVGGVQLVETFSAQVGCGYAFNLDG